MLHDVDSLLSEIQFLRRKLEFFEQHHQCCSIARPASPPVDDAASPPVDDAASPPVDDETEPSAELQIVPFSPQDIKVSKPRDTIPRWRQIADQILADVIPEQWIERREDLGLHTDKEAAWLTTAIFGAQVQKLRRQATSQLEAGIMVSAQAYAEDTKATREHADMFRQIHNFMELVLVSLCAVLEILNYPVDQINETMRICLSNSKDDNLKRLRRGALWVNRTIVDIGKTDIGGKGTELFFIYGVSTSKYSILAGNTDSGPHFVKHMLGLKLEDSRDGTQPEAPTFTPLCIPAYIKVLVGDEITLSQICVALGYGGQYVTTELCEQYRNLALKGGSDPVTFPPLATKKRKQSSNKRASAKRRQRPSNNPSSIVRRTTVNGQNFQEVNKTTAFRCEQFQPSLDCGLGDAFGSEGNGGSMGWENMFDPPEVGSLGWENMFDPLEVGNLGWESMFKPPDVSSLGWEPVFPLPEVDSTG